MQLKYRCVSTQHNLTSSERERKREEEGERERERVSEPGMESSPSGYTDIM